ncbi:hypothetical protein NE237_003168 [Protea cynaroides]|uniref:Uncharacterized protein n=1 Tax=Protea cynaroides TaxID=273540 RepID=A0A9Q0KGJ1_9MAGN|nr:hypothetical protein NE237_003168 [Protea cynaroides]
MANADGRNDLVQIGGNQDEQRMLGSDQVVAVQVLDKSANQGMPMTLVSTDEVSNANPEGDVTSVQVVNTSVNLVMPVNLVPADEVDNSMVGIVLPTVIVAPIPPIPEPEEQNEVSLRDSSILLLASVGRNHNVSLSLEAHNKVVDVTEPSVVVYKDLVVSATHNTNETETGGDSSKENRYHMITEKVQSNDDALLNQKM